MAMTRSWAGASTSGYIPEDAARWAIEKCIPIDARILQEYLSGHSLAGEPDFERAVFEQALVRIEKHVDAFAATQQREFCEVYQPQNPDREHMTPCPEGPHSSGGGSIQCDRVERPPTSKTIEHFRSLLDAAAYESLDQAQIESCAGIASQWGVPLHVDFELFEDLHVFARGDIMGARTRRRLRKLYRQELVDVPTYQRMVVIFRLRDDCDLGEGFESGFLHLRLFKNIPKQDIDMLLPGTTVKISGVDRVKIILPSLGGFLMSVRKIAQYALLFAVLALHWTAILFALVVGYLIKSFFSYFQTKKRYQLNLTRNLYFQKLDTNTGVGYYVVAQAANQLKAECILAYFAIATHSGPISPRKLRRRCERLIRECIDLEIEFRAERTIEKLQAVGLIAVTPEGIGIQSSRSPSST